MLIEFHTSQMVNSISIACYDYFFFFFLWCITTNKTKNIDRKTAIYSRRNAFTVETIYKSFCRHIDIDFRIVFFSLSTLLRYLVILFIFMRRMGIEYIVSKTGFIYPIENFLCLFVFILSHVYVFSFLFTPSIYCQPSLATELGIHLMIFSNRKEKKKNRKEIHCEFVDAKRLRISIARSHMNTYTIKFTKIHLTNIAICMRLRIVNFDADSKHHVNMFGFVSSSQIHSN